MKTKYTPNSTEKTTKFSFLVHVSIKKLSVHKLSLSLCRFVQRTTRSTNGLLIDSQRNHALASTHLDVRAIVVIMDILMIDLRSPIQSNTLTSTINAVKGHVASIYM